MRVILVTMTAGLPGDKILGGDFLNKSNQGNNGELQTVALDMEWVQLMLAAKKQGIHADEIRRFLGDKTLKAM